MTYRSAEDIKAEAARRGIRREFVVTALLSEMEAGHGHLTHLTLAYGERDGPTAKPSTEKIRNTNCGAK